MKIRKLYAATIAASAVLATQAGWAQPMLEEVIVTAQKRSESVQDVPSTVNVLSADALSEFNVQDFTDLEALTPGMSIDKDTGRSGSIALRGVTFDPSSAAEAAVTVAWNGSIVDGNAVFQQLFDLERIEVLRGPQGTLQGRSSPAGAINLHTAKPNMDEMEGQIKATMQDNDGFNTQFGLSVPLIEGVLALRVAGVYDESDLNEVKNDLTGDETSAETKAGRFALSWLASETLSMDFTYQYLDNEVNSITVLEGVPTGSPVLDPEGVLRPLDAFDKRGVVLGPDITNADFSNSVLAIEWDLPGHLLSSVTGYHETSSDRLFDQALGSANPDNIKQREASDEREDFTQEIRLANTDADFWEYMVGVYYENSEVSFTQNNHLRPGGPFSPANQVLLFPVETDRLGAFTHNKFYLNEQWTLQLGARYQENKVDRDLVFVAGADGFPPSFAPGDLIADVLSPENKSYDTDAVTGSASVQYAFAESGTQVYLNYSTGWRPGGLTVTGALLPEDTLLFGEEESSSVELGFKATLLDGRMRLNGAAFYQDFDDFITRVTALNVRDLTGAINQAGITENADAEITGAELEFDALLTERWHLGGGISYTDAKFKSGATLSCNEYDANGSPVIPEGEIAATCDVGGDEMGGLPEWSATVNTDYTIPVGAFEGYARLLWRYVGSRPNDELGTLSSYNTTDIHFGLRSDQWDVSLFARNAFDEEAVRDGTFSTQQVRRTDTGYGARNLLASRVVGLSASYRF